MSTLSILPGTGMDFTDGAVRPAAVEQAAAAGRLRLTRRGRIVVLAGFLAVVAAVMVALGPIATAAFEAGSPEPVRIVQVGPGDTLYGIAGDIAEPGKVREMVAQIQRLNALDGPQLQVGQRLAVPMP